MKTKVVMTITGMLGDRSDTWVRYSDYLELKDAATELLDATGHTTWSRLFKAPSVERAIEKVKALLREQDK